MKARIDLGEGPFNTSEDAQTYANCEVHDLLNPSVVKFPEDFGYGIEIDSDELATVADYFDAKLRTECDRSHNYGAAMESIPAGDMGCELIDMAAAMLGTMRDIDGAQRQAIINAVARQVAIFITG
jgi:hypothetical protein